MIAMQRLQPEMKKLQAKYKGAENREMLNQEMMRLYKDNGTSPFGACLPSLLQMPFLIVLYTLIRGLSTTVTKTINGHKAVIGAPRYIPTNSQMHHDLVVSQGQMHWWFGMDLSSYPFSNHTMNPFTHVVSTSVSQAVLVIPYLVLIAAAMFLQYYQMKQMNSRNPQAAAANPQMQTMQKFFPIIFGFIYLRVPAGATIYMVVSSAMRIGTQEVMFKTGMVEPVAVEREIGSGKQDKQDKPPPAAKPEPKPSKASKRSTATDGTALAKGTVPPKKADTNGRPNTNANGRKPGAGKRPANGKGAAAEEPPAPKPQNRSRSKRARKAR
jgi:YidC/Oxa1 family membrane protein insertase